MRCTIDHSEESRLNRRYEADADRGFYKALKEFRQAEAEAKERIRTVPDPEPPPSAEPKVGSFRETSPPAGPGLPEAFLDDPTLEKPAVQAPKGRRNGRDRTLPPPG